MFPISDASRKPAHFPLVTVLLIAANALVFLIELANGETFINRWALIPAQITAGQGWITILTAMFLHAGWAHILGNMLFLWVFGPEIEDAMGRFRYFLFYLLGGLAATLAQILTAPASRVPNLGASGAIAAVLGAFLIIYPRDRIRTILILGWFVKIALVPAAVLIGLWFVTQLFSEVGALIERQMVGVAYMAHVGGFLFGLLAVKFFEIRRRQLPLGFLGR